MVIYWLRERAEYHHAKEENSINLFIAFTNLTLFIFNSLELLLFFFKNI